MTEPVVGSGPAQVPAPAPAPDGARRGAETLLGDARLDAVVGICLELAAEAWVLRRRVQVLESLLQAGGSIEPGAVESFELDAAASARNREERARFVARVLEPVSRL